MEVYFAGVVSNDDPLKMPDVPGFISKKLVTDPNITKKIAEVFQKINADTSADQQAAAKASMIARRLRRFF